MKPLALTLLLCSIASNMTLAFMPPPLKEGAFGMSAGLWAANQMPAYELMAQWKPGEWIEYGGALSYGRFSSYDHALLEGSLMLRFLKKLTESVTAGAELRFGYGHNLQGEGLEAGGQIRIQVAYLFLWEIKPKLSLSFCPELRLGQKNLQDWEHKRFLGNQVSLLVPIGWIYDIPWVATTIYIGPKVSTLKSPIQLDFEAGLGVGFQLF